MKTATTTATKTRKATAATLAGLALAWGAAAQTDDLPGPIPPWGAMPRRAIPEPTPPWMADEEAALRHGRRLPLDQVRRMTAQRRSNLLTLAAARGHADMVDSLIEGGADPNKKVWGGGIGATGGIGLSPLAAAASSGNPQVVRRLLDAGADPIAWNPDQHSVLDHALGIHEKTEKLIGGWTTDPDKMRNANARPWSANVPEATTYEISPGQREIVRMLLKAGANANERSHQDRTTGLRRLSPLTVAIAAGDTELANLLLDHRARPDHPRISDNTMALPALIACAAHCCDTNLAKRLLLSGANISATFHHTAYTQSEFEGVPTRTATTNLVTALQVARNNECSPDLVAFFEDPLKDATTKTLFDGLFYLVGGVGSPPAPPEGDASIANDEREAEPAGQPSTGDEPAGGSSGSAR